MSSALSFKNTQNNASSSQRNSSVQSDAKQQQQPSQQNIKLLKSLEKFTINDHQYYVALIRKSGASSFRLSIIEKNNTCTCWTSSELQFDKIRNEALSGNMEDFRNHLISALSNPNDHDYQIKHVIQKKSKKTNVFEIQILRKAAGITVLIANIKCYLAKHHGTNLFYLLDKASATLEHQKQDNTQYRRDNINFQKKYNESLQHVEEAISAKNKQEQQLLSKFVMILNEKKKKIRALQREINRLKGQNNVKDQQPMRPRIDDQEEENDEMDVDEKGSQPQGDALEQPMDNDAHENSSGFYVSLAEINAYDPQLEAQSPSFGTNQREKQNKDNTNQKRKGDRSTANVLGMMNDASLGFGDQDDDTPHRKKRKREYDNDETLESFVPPEQKKRKIVNSQKQERDDEGSDSSFGFSLM